jgi:hypothetical protein
MLVGVGLAPKLVPFLVARHPVADLELFSIGVKAIHASLVKVLRSAEKHLSYFLCLPCLILISGDECLHLIISQVP